MSSLSSDITYTPDSPLRQPRSFFRAMVADFSSARDLAVHLMARNVRAQYRQSVLGYLWLLLPPLATALIWLFLRAARITTFPETGVPYPVYLLTGLFLWQGFVKMLTLPQQHLNASRHLLARIKFPWEAVLLAAAGEVLFEFAVYLAVLGGVFLVFRIEPDAGMLLAPPAIAALLAWGFAIGLFLVPWGLLYQDVTRAVGIAVMLFFFLLPIVYPTPAGGLGRLAVSVNPVAILLVASRDLLTTGETAFAVPAAVAGGLAMPLILASWLVHRLAVPHLIARLSS